MFIQFYVFAQMREVFCNWLRLILNLDSIAFGRKLYNEVKPLSKVIARGDRYPFCKSRPAQFYNYDRVQNHSLLL